MCTSKYPVACDCMVAFCIPFELKTMNVALDLAGNYDVKSH